MAHSQIKNFLVNGTSRTYAIAEITANTKRRLEEYVEDLYSYDLVDFLQQINDDFYTMDELDDTFEFMSVTEILEELRDIDTNDEYFNADSKTSGNDAWEVADVSIDRAVDLLFEEAICWDDEEYKDIMKLHQELLDDLDREYKKYETAKALFEQALENDVEGVINVLWNMNQE